MADNKRRGLDVGLEKAYSDIATGIADTVASAASKLKYAHEQGMAGAFGMGTQPSISQPTKIAAQQAPAAPTVPSPAVTAPVGLTPPAVFNPKGARGEGFADVTSPQPQQERGLGGYFNETEWSKAAEELRSIIRGDNPRMRTMWHFEPGVGRYSTEEAVPQSGATKRAAMAHLYGMLPERLRADVGLQGHEIEGRYGLQRAAMAAEAEREKIRALEGRSATDDSLARDKLMLEAIHTLAPRAETNDPATGEKTTVLDVKAGRKSAEQLFGIGESTQQAQRPSQYDIWKTVRPVREAHARGDKNMARMLFERLKSEGKTPDDVVGLVKEERDWLWKAAK